MENVKKKVLALVLGFCCAWQMAWGIVLAAAEKEAGKTGIPTLVYDGDPGSDDALALFLLKQNSLVPDLAFATYGNGPEKQMSSNMVLVTGALAMDLPIYQGADRPWKGRKLKFKESGFNGKDGLLGLASMLKEKSQGRDRKTLQPGDLEEAQKQLKKCRHITYIVTGPLSTLAGLLQDPEVKSRIDRVYLVGGVPDRNGTRAGSRNQFCPGSQGREGGDGKRAGSDLVSPGAYRDPVYRRTGDPEPGPQRKVAGIPGIDPSQPGSS